MWGNRFGKLTAVRYPISQTTLSQVEAAIRDELEPASVGLFFQPVREQALTASVETVDFGQHSVSLYLLYLSVDAASILPFFRGD